MPSQKEIRQQNEENILPDEVAHVISLGELGLEISSIDLSPVVDREGNHHSIELYLNPTTFDDETQKRLVQDLTPLAGIGFLRKDINAQSLYDDVANHVLDCNRLIVMSLEGETTGFIATTIREFSGLVFYHLEGIITHPDFHGTGLSKKALIQDTLASDADYLAFHTQSNAMYHLGLKVANINDADSKRFGHVIESSNQQGVIDVGRYGGQSLYEDVDTFSKTAIQEINWRNGDARICIGKIRK